KDGRAIVNRRNSTPPRRYHGEQGKRTLRPNEAIAGVPFVPLASPRSHLQKSKECIGKSMMSVDEAMVCSLTPRPASRDRYAGSILFSMTYQPSGACSNFCARPENFCSPFGGKKPPPIDLYTLPAIRPLPRRSPVTRLWVIWDPGEDQST